MIKEYQINIDGRNYDFRIKSLRNGIIYLSIPDPGGQMDSVPKYPEQLEWLEGKLKGFAGLEQNWPISWEIKSKEALKKLEEMFIGAGGKLSYNSQD